LPSSTALAASLPPAVPAVPAVSAVPAVPAAGPGTPAPPPDRPRTDDLPPPAPLVRALARSVVEILAGARDLDQVARWVTDDVYRHLEARVVLAARARAAHGRRPGRPAVRLGDAVLSDGGEGIVDAVVVAHTPSRSRAVAIRLEGHGQRWRASSVHVL